MGLQFSQPRAKKDDFATESRVHGWNPIYRVPRNSSQKGPFQSFAFDTKPGSFAVQLIKVVIGIDPQVLDHQGHIVPQKMLKEELTLAANDMVKHFDTSNPTKDTLSQFVAQYGKTYPWLVPMTDYYNALLDQKMPPAFDMSARTLDEKVGPYFSIAMWNPINICRAPVDTIRTNPPIGGIDGEVLKYIGTAKNNVPHDKAWLDAAQTLNSGPSDLNDPTFKKNLKAYVNAMNATLSGSSSQLSQGQGFYQFPWKNSRISPKKKPEPQKDFLSPQDL